MVSTFDHKYCLISMVISTDVCLSMRSPRLIVRPDVRIVGTLMADRDQTIINSRLQHKIKTYAGALVVIIE